jgi:hypothetical protein
VQPDVLLCKTVSVVQSRLELLFVPAYEIDELIGYSPERPIFNPARPVALATDR